MLQYLQQLGVYAIELDSMRTSLIEKQPENIRNAIYPAFMTCIATGWQFISQGTPMSLVLQSQLKGMRQAIQQVTTNQEIPDVALRYPDKELSTFAIIECQKGMHQFFLDHSKKQRNKTMH